jgi:diguanylate cyclase (GGDEF)-like protein
VPAAVALACTLLAPPRAAAGDAARAASAAAPPAAFKPADELGRLEYLARSQPSVAVTALLRYADTLAQDDPRHLEALMEAGTGYVTLSMDDQVEQVARRVESLAGDNPLARPAAMLLRGQWLDAHGDVGRAERQIIEANALFPREVPAWLRIRLLLTAGDIKQRGGHYDEAMIRFNETLRLVDESAPAWRRVDMRRTVSNALMEAGQLDKASEMGRELMELARETGDELGLSRAYTLHAILGRDMNTQSPEETLADWRAAVEHARLSGNQQQLSLSLANIADYYVNQGDFQIAYEMSMRALVLARETKSQSAESVALANAGLALLGQRRKDEGIKLVHESMALDEHSGSPRYVADLANELGRALEKGGYHADALAAYRQYRQMADELNQQDRQRAVIELQEGFGNERRQHELDMLGREGRLKDEELLHRSLEMKLWGVAGVSTLLLLAVVGSLARRLRVRNRQLTDSNERLRLQAEVDPLTGVANRHHLHGVMASRPGLGLEGTLYLIDLDNFKEINDRCGHAGGDSVLVEIARRLRAALRGDDLVVRWGGEEFLVLVRALPASESEALAQRLLAAFADTPVMHEGHPLPVSASIGYATFPLRSDAGAAASSDASPGLAVGWERAISLIDSAMYLAKARGRNGACCIRRVGHADGDALEAIGANLESAANDGRVALHFQQGPSLHRSAA